MSIKLSELPQSIQKLIPYSIRTYKDEYELEDLPAVIRNIIEKFIEQKNNVSYSTVFDVTPNLSEYGDFQTIATIKSLVLEYLKNYFMIFPEDYPFDPNFGSRLKKYLHMRDTSLQQTLISTEVQNIITVISADLNTTIGVEDVSIVPISKDSHTDYTISIKVKIGDVLATLNL